jgi:phosphoglycerate dehydrogenase-like enzyme
LVSFGKIARNLAKKAAAIGFGIRAFDPFVDDAVFADAGVERMDLPELLATSDVVSLHCPLTPATTHLMNRQTLALMKPGAILINTSRGTVVSEPDLVAALQEGRLNGAGLDVFEKEPLPQDSPLLKMNNVVLTSHAASVSEKAVETLQRKAAEAARDFLLGKDPVSRLV